MRPLAALLLAFFAGAVHGQVTDADRAALDEARSRLEGLTDPRSDADADWKKLVEARVRLLELLEIPVIHLRLPGDVSTED